MLVVNKPFRIIVERIQGFWTVFRTNAKGTPKYYGKLTTFEQARGLVALIIENNLLCRICEVCKRPYLPRATDSRVCGAHSVKEIPGLSQETLSTNQGENNQNEPISETGTNNTNRGTSRNGSGNVSDPQGTNRSGFECLAQNNTSEPKQSGSIAEPRPVQSSNTQGQNGHRPEHKATDKDSLEASSQVPSGQTATRQSSEQVKALRAKEYPASNASRPYKCKYCGLVKSYTGALPLPVYCPPCTKLIEEDRQRAASQPPSRKAWERMMKEDTNTRTI